MGQITIDQSHAVVSVLSTHVDWASIDFEAAGLQDAVLRDKQEAGRQFAAFLKNGCRMFAENFFRETGELTLQMPALAPPTLEQLQASWSDIESIEFDLSPTGPSALTLGTVLRPGEGTINGPEYQRRLAPKLSDTFGFQHGIWLIENQDKFPELMALLGKVYIDLPGLRVVFAGGCRCFPYLGRGGGRWSLRWLGFGSDLYQDGRIATRK